MIKRTLGFAATVCVAAGLLQAITPWRACTNERGKRPFRDVTSVKFTNPPGSLALAVENQVG
jgi:hypothetical protein